MEPGEGLRALMRPAEPLPRPSDRLRSGPILCRKPPSLGSRHLRLFARVRAERGALPRALNLVSGPSRTGDIEQTIVLGAHGPRRLHIVLVG